MMVFACIYFTYPESASAVTRDEAIEWLKKWDGTTGGIDLDGTNYGYQCTDFVSGYMNWLVCGDYSNTNYYKAYTPSYYPTVASGDTDRWQVIDNTTEFIADPGDIFVSNAHVGVVISSTMKKATVVEQNTRNGYNDETGTLPWVHEITWTAKGKGAYGVNKYIRFKQFETKPTNGTLDVNFFINGNDIVDISGIGSFTIKVGNNTYTNQTDFCKDIAVGTSYAISNIKASSGYSYTGVSEGSLSGSVGSGRTNIRLNFYNIYTVQYNANGGSGAPSSQTKTHGKTLTLSSTKPKRDHYVFLGWATSQNATSAVYQPGGNYTSNAGTTLYAVWKPEEYAVTYDGNGDDVGNVPARHSKVYGMNLTLSALIPTRIGYTFLGWGTSADATSASYTAGASYTENKALKLYAIWQITNPPKLSASDDIIMLVGDRRNWQDFVTLEHDGVLSYSLKASVSGDASLKGDTIKAVSAGKATIEVSVTEYPAAKCTVNVQIIDLSRMITLPDDLTEIGSKAFANTKLSAVTIPNGCTTIAAKAFANNKSLVYVYIPNSVESIATDAFVGCRNVAIYCNSGSVAEKFAQSNGLRYYTPSESWVLVSDLPAAAKVTADKWTYNLTTTETTTSTKTSLEGYTQTGFIWQKKGSGTWIYANYPGGFDKGHSLYKAYNQSALSASLTETTKREVSSASRKSYIYWHWTFTDNVDEDNRNVVVEDARRTGVNIGGSVYRDFVFFDAFETTESLSTEGMTTSGLKSYDGMYSTYHHPEYNKAEYASWWWWRFEVYNQTYTDYEKLFSYSKTVVTQKESDQEVAEGAGVSDVRHWVKYTF